VGAKVAEARGQVLDPLWWCPVVPQREVGFAASQHEPGLRPGAGPVGSPVTSHENAGPPGRLELFLTLFQLLTQGVLS
jgi:hypothetical protein